MAKLVPILRSLLCRKGTSGVRDESGDYKLSSGLFVTRKRGQYSHFWEILDVSDDCKWFSKANIGQWVRLPEWHQQLMRPVVENKLFIVKEQIFEPRKDAKGKPLPSYAPGCVFIQ